MGKSRKQNQADELAKLSKIPKNIHQRILLVSKSKHFRNYSEKM